MRAVHPVCWARCGPSTRGRWDSSMDNVFGGFFFGIGFAVVVAFVANVVRQRDAESLKCRKCPFCAALVKRHAPLCENCGHDLPPLPPISRPPEGYDPPACSRCRGRTELVAILNVAGPPTLYVRGPEWFFKCPKCNRAYSYYLDRSRSASFISMRTDV
jgi:uncharacterized C2H2 Zn-finger protein